MSTSTPLVPGHVDALLLAIVSRGPIHGYAIIERLRSSSDGVFDLPEGTVYPALYRLERLGLVQSQERSVDGRKRRVYSLTRTGRAALQERKRIWHRVAHGMSAVLGRT
jgi:DNA-binding PadR family transcriptional regulator